MTVNSLRDKIKKALGNSDLIEVDIVTVNNKEILRLGGFVVNEGPTEAVLLDISKGEVDSNGAPV